MLLQTQLISLGLKPSRIVISSVRASFFRHCELIDDAGLIEGVNKSVKHHLTTRQSTPRVKRIHKTSGTNKRRTIIDLLRRGIKKARIAERVGVSRAYVTQIASRLDSED